MTWSIYLGSVYDNPERIKIIRQFVNGDVTLCEGCVQYPIQNYCLQSSK